MNVKPANYSWQTFYDEIIDLTRYSFSPRASVMLVQDYSLIFLPRQPGTTNNSAQQYTTRVGLRYGLGDRGARY